MSETMIERAARAMYTNVVLMRGGHAVPYRKYDDMSEAEKLVAKTMARAAIETLREPTPEMGFAGCQSDGWPNSVWRAMIDAALSEQSETQEDVR